MHSSLVLNDLRKVFPAFELGPLTHTFGPGRVCGLLGPNGAGKTTLLDVIALQTRATSGEVRYGGKAIAWGDRRWKSRLAFVRETPSFYGELTAAETLAFAGRLHERWDAGLAARMASRLGLNGRQRVGQLSKGTRVKLGIVAALAQRAELLILDEPTAGVDPTAREELYEVIRDLRTERPELCVLWSSHIFGDFEASADDVLILRDGRIVFHTSQSELALMSLHRVDAGDDLPRSEDVHLAWVARGHGWVLTPRGSATDHRLSVTPGAVQEPQGSVLAALYHGTAEIAGGRA